MYLYTYHQRVSGDSRHQRVSGDSRFLYWNVEILKGKSRMSVPEENYSDREKWYIQYLNLSP